MGIAHQDNLTDSVQAVLPGTMYLDWRQPKDNPTRVYTLHLKKKNEWFGKFEAQVLPGCCGVQVISHVDVAAYKEKDLGQKRLGIALDIIEKAAQRARYGGIVMTLFDKQTTNDILTKRGYLATHFVNGKTKNELVMFFKVLPQEKKQEAAPEKVRFDNDE